LVVVPVGVDSFTLLRCYWLRSTTVVLVPTFLLFTFTGLTRLFIWLRCCFGSFWLLHFRLRSFVRWLFVVTLRYVALLFTFSFLRFLLLIYGCLRCVPVVTSFTVDLLLLLLHVPLIHGYIWLLLFVCCCSFCILVVCVVYSVWLCVVPVCC
jgi:hypothetical protein